MAQTFNSMTGQLRRMLTGLRRLAAVLNNTSDMVSMIDMQGNIIYVNLAGMAMLGRTGQEPTSLALSDFHPAEAGRRLQQEHLPAIMEQGHHTWENVVQHADGYTIPVSQVSMLIRNEAGEPGNGPDHCHAVDWQH